MWLADKNKLIYWARSWSTQWDVKHHTLQVLILRFVGIEVVGCKRKNDPAPQKSIKLRLMGMFVLKQERHLYSGALDFMTEQTAKEGGKGTWSFIRPCLFSCCSRGNTLHIMIVILLLFLKSMQKIRGKRVSWSLGSHTYEMWLICFLPLRAVTAAARQADNNSAHIQDHNANNTYTNTHIYHIHKY